MRRRYNLSKRNMLVFILIYAVMIIILSLQILGSSHLTVSLLNLIAVIGVSLIVGGFIREWFMMREQERRSLPIYRYTEDEGEIDQAEGLLYRELFEPLGMEHSVRDELRAEGQERYFIAKVEHKLVGVMVLTVNGDTAELHHAAVNKAYRGKEIGISLWNVVHEYAKREGIRTIHLYSRNTAFGFWRRCGLEAVSDEWIEHERFTPHNIRYKKMEMNVS
jgi:N-acetylglutamate synthase-like GNAT family acetyltransferase